jgi:S-adenosyl-L-methionine hydrolase (adenosine-forming)
MPPLITMATDFGSEDPYVGIMKGVILKINPRAVIVDLTHALSNQCLLEAAFILQTAYPYFPEGTIHVAVVDPGVGGNRRLIGIQVKDRLWVGPDNGVFTLVIKENPRASLFSLSNRKYFLKNISATFHGRDILAPVAAHLSSGVSLKEIGDAISDPVLLCIPEPEIKGDKILGQVLWVDHFGNLITNIKQEWLHPFFSSPSLKIKIGNKTISEIHQTYSQGKTGRLMALIGSSGHLEIASNQASAAKILGFRPDKIMAVVVAF